MRADPERTDQVFELNVALDGGDTERLYQAFLAEPDGHALLAARPNLLEALSNRERLRAMRPDSLGRAYATLMDRAGLASDGLDQEAEKIPEFAELTPGEERSWFARRSDCVHDLLHVVSGYGQDPAGETSLLAFTDGVYGHAARMRVIRFGLVASILSAPARSIPRAIAFAMRARRRGARAQIPFSYAWEDALPLPLWEVREALGVTPTVVAHPRGVLHGTIDSPWAFGPALC
jgi:ubiquinone biosynthesis protein COQ4